MPTIYTYHTNVFKATAKNQLYSTRYQSII